MNVVAIMLALLRRAAMALASRWRNLYYRASGVRIRGYIWMRAVEIPQFHRNIELTSCSLDSGVILLCGGQSDESVKLSIGRGSYLNRHTFVDAVESVIIGEGVAIGPGCYITDHDHGHDVTKSPLAQAAIARPTRIGDCVWLGANVVVLKDVTIGERTIVGAGSVVTRSLPPNVVAVGVPARVLRQRQAIPAPTVE